MPPKRHKSNFEKQKAKNKRQLNRLENWRAFLAFCCLLLGRSQSHNLKNKRQKAKGKRQLNRLENWRAFLAFCSLSSSKFQCTSCFGGGNHGKKQKANGKKQIFALSIHAAPL
jgi:hypothetical protein